MPTPPEPQEAMIEAVARALCCETPEEWADRSEEAKDSWLIDAKAAIAAAKPFIEAKTLQEMQKWIAENGLFLARIGYAGTIFESGHDVEDFAKCRGLKLEEE